MNQKWMKREGQKWVEDKIITSEQLDLLVARYPDTKEQSKITGILPILASVLIAIGILSFIASNWSEIPPFARLSLLIFIMISFYTAGDRYLKKGHEALGTSLNLLGIVSFGASIILLGQTFHLSAVDARLFVFWSLPAVYYLYRDRSKLYLFLLAALTIGGQIYSLNEFQSFSYLLLFLFITCIGGFVFLYPRKLETELFTIGLSTQIFILLIVKDFNLLWFLLFGFALYTAGSWVHKSVFKQSFKRLGTIIGFGFAYGLYFFLTNEIVSDFEPHKIYYLSVFILILALSIYAKRAENTFLSIWELLIFLPYFFLVELTDALAVGLLYLIVMFVYSGFMLAAGYRSENRAQINFGIVLFLLVCLMGYFNLAWAFMPKSIFFLIGGILLFILNAFLQRKKKQILKNGGPHHE
ncbi:DUF2157 domain-containing protein [Fictibacillus nanhaiensis]|uniref:DUF2157 domain-containing protein n=1 Tax=Fictibacillus nanhaiensis TaxID=742169 RepID=UPI001C93E516|nr:DUF2157 domain-containing protein [Fictibacillus nanhaiensis]MBY6038011.1 DUF2157 domain-containing protein [Fictibacillus nanhaiensis]